MVKPKVNSAAEQELEKAQKQFEAYDQNIKDMTLDRMNQAPVKETEQQTKIAQRDMNKLPDVYLKPSRTIASREKFNEDYRDEYNFAKQYVHFVAENKEIIGERIEMWTKPFAGLPAEFWEVPVNKPIWAPRYVAERIKGCRYHRLIMNENRTVGSDGAGQYYGQMVAETTNQRLDAQPVSERKSVFMSADF